MASPIAHGIAGIGIYWFSVKNRNSDRQGFSKKEIAGGITAFILANSADFDLIAGWVAGRYMHSQITHTPAFAIAIGLLAAMIAPLLRIKPFQAFLLTSLIVGSHVVVDFFTKDTSYPSGCMLFWPFSNRYFISPVSVFPDIWRGSPALMFGFNNINAAIREIALGGAFLMIVNRYSLFPVFIRKYLPRVTIISGFLAMALHYPLQTMAQQQMISFWGLSDPITDSSVTHGILFSSDKYGSSDIYRIQPDGTGLTRLTSTSSNDSRPVWSPNGQWIAFQSDRSGKTDIWIMAADGSQTINLTERSNSTNESPAWTALGNQIVFSSNRTGNFELFIMARNGKSVKQVTESSPEKKVLPAVSPVDGLVAYTQENPDKPGWSVFLKSLNRGTSREISPKYGCRAKWSPDGKSLCYVSDNPAAKSDICIFPLKGSSITRVTYSNEYDYDPAFSPDGNRIVFSRGRNGEKQGWDLWIIDLDTGREKRLTNDGLNNRYPSWR